MAGMNVAIKPEIISWILQVIQFDNVAVSVIDLLSKWKSGEKTPTFNQVEEISRKTNIPFGYFFLDRPPVEDCPLADYRTVKSVAVSEPSRNLIDTLDSMQDIQDWMTDYVIDNGQEKLTFVGAAAGVEDADAVADDIRKVLQLDQQWFLQSASVMDSFRLIKNVFEQAGILVMMNGIVGNNTRRKLNVDEFRAFTLVNSYAPLIFINTGDTDTGKLFSLLHELAHIWIGKNSLYNMQMNASAESNDEKLCNAITAEVLAPKDVFLEKWEETEGTILEKVEALAKVFKCSRFVIARRARDFKKITQEAYLEIVHALTEKYHEWKAKQDSVKSTGGDYYRTLQSRLDHRLVISLANSASEGRTQYSEVYRLTNTNRKSFGKLLSDIGGSGWS